MKSPLRRLRWKALTSVLFMFVALCRISAAEPEPIKSIWATVQIKPGSAAERVEMSVYEAPVDPATMSADSAPLEDDDLVLGVVVEGQAMAYPIRYIALSEVVDDRIGETALAPTW